MSTLTLGRARAWLPLSLVLLLGLALRLALWGNLPRLGAISDEGEYLAAASWLAQGRGFAWYQGYLWTRAPLYPLFIAAHLRLFGPGLAPAFASQTLLSLLIVALVYALALQVTGYRVQGLPVAALAAGMAALYLPFAIYTQVLLSELLFIALLLAAFLALTRWQYLVTASKATGSLPSPHLPAPSPAVAGEGGPRSGGGEGQRRCRMRMSVWCNLPRSALLLALGGALLGLCTLTRSLTLAFLPLAALWAGWTLRRVGGRSWHQALLASVLLAVCALAPVLPWTIYNSRLYGGLVIVDTTGAYNLLVGAQTAFDGGRSDAAARDKVLALLADLPPKQRLQRLRQAQTCLLVHDDAAAPPALLTKPQLTQADRQQFMLAEGLCLLRAKPLAFVSKSAAELVDLFQINYGGDERFSDGFAVGRLPGWYALALFLLDDTLYVFALPLAVVGWLWARGLPGRGLIGLWWGYNIAAAPLLFAINRFRLPLLPFAFIFAALAIVALWQRLREARRGREPETADLKTADLKTADPGMPVEDLRPYSISRSPGLSITANRLPLALALLLWLIAATPYAYVEPLGPNDDSRWASYFGFYPSSLDSTLKALRSRETYLRGEQLRLALRKGDLALAQRLLDAGELPRKAARAGRVTLLATQGRYDEALLLLPSTQEISATRDVEASVLRGDLLRSLGQERAAKDLLTPEFVDSANPVQWAWDWLHPLPTRRIDFGGNLDLGYIRGCYLGEGDRSISPPTTFRWCSDGAELRFPKAGTGQPQTLLLRVDGRGWPSDMLPAPPAQLIAAGQVVAEFTPDRAGVRDFSLSLPLIPPGADLVLTLRTHTFVPDASDYLSQQGKQVGQLRRLGLRLDWADLKP